MSDKSPGENIHPRVDFSNKKQGKSPVLSSAITGYELFELAQKKSKNGRQLESYGADVTRADTQEKQNILMIELSQYISDMSLGPVPRGDDNMRDYDRDAKKGDRDAIEMRISDSIVSLVEKIGILSGGYESLRQFSIQKGVLTLSSLIPPRKSETIYNLNLLEIFQNVGGKFILDEKKLAQAFKNPVTTSLEALKSDLDTESYFGGTVVVTYDRVSTGRDVASKVAGVTGTIMATSALFDTARYNIGRVMFRDHTGRMQELDKSVIRQFSSYVGTKTQLNELMFRMMAASGRTFNVVRNAFTSLQMAAIDRSAKVISGLKYSDALKNNPQITVEEFEKTQGEFSTKVSKLTEKGIDAFLREMNPSVGLKSAMGYSMHYLFWGVFFKEYQKHYTDRLAIYKGLAETGAFYAGAKFGASLTQSIWKPVSAMVVGGVSAALVGAAGSSEAFDKKMWKMMPGRFSGDGSKSVTAHVATGGAMNDMLDKTDDTDMRLPGGRGGWRIYNPFGKDVIMGDIALSQTTIDFGASPREYLSARIAPTEHWNKRMDEFVGTEQSPGFVVPEIQKILLDFREQRGLFAHGNIRNYDSGIEHKGIPEKQWRSKEDSDPKISLDKRKMALRERLLPIIGGTNSNIRTRAIVEDAVEYVTETISPIKNPDEQKKLLEIFFRNYGNVLKIDTETLKDDEKILKNDGKYLFQLLGDFASETGGKEGDFAKQIFARLFHGTSLLKELKSTIGKGSNSATRRYNDPVEETLYHHLLDDSTALTQDQYEKMGLTKKEDQKGKTCGDYFVFLLGTLVEYREQKRYIDNAKNIGYANKWSM